MQKDEVKDCDVMFVYTRVERNDGSHIPVRIGTAWLRMDGSIRVQLDALPVNGSLTIRNLNNDE